MMVTAVCDFDAKNYCLAATSVNDDSGKLSMRLPKPINYIDIYMFLFSSSFKYQQQYYCIHMLDK